MAEIGTFELRRPSHGLV